MKNVLGVLFLLAAAITPAFPVHAAEVSVAVAANFTSPMEKIAAAFESETGHKAVLSFGATGNFYAQIRNGAPFQVLLAADQEVPARLETEGFAAPGSRYTYATGRLVLWSAQPGMVDDKGDVLRRPGEGRIALANPKLAPYGAAAIQAMTALGLLGSLQPRFGQGENIAQTYLFVATGNAPLGFVALSQVLVGGQLEKGSAWVVPANLHTPIRQDAVLLAKGKDNAAAIALMAYLRGNTARTLIRSFGYQF